MLPKVASSTPNSRGTSVCAESCLLIIVCCVFVVSDVKLETEIFSAGTDIRLLRKVGESPLLLPTHHLPLSTPTTLTPTSHPQLSPHFPLHTHNSHPHFNSPGPLHPSPHPQLSPLTPTSHPHFPSPSLPLSTPTPLTSHLSPSPSLPLSIPTTSHIPHPLNSSPPKS